MESTARAPLVRLGVAPGRPARILLVEDERAAAEVIAEGLAQHGHRVEVASTLRLARRELAAAPFDLLILDIRLPDGSGLDLCEEIRERDEVPVIIASGAGTPDERIAGFDAGADDYVVKPLDVTELARRVAAVLRRSGFQAANSLLGGPDGLALDVRLGVALYRGHEVRLTRSETGILRTLIDQLDTAVSLQDLSFRVWNYQSLGDGNFLHQHVSRLRRKLRQTGFPDELIRTVYGVGYALMSTSDATLRDALAAEDRAG